MSNENPYQPPAAEPENDTVQASPSKFGLKVNSRPQDNLLQAAIIGVTTAILGFIGAEFYGVVGSLSGAFLGMVAGLLISGTYLLIAKGSK